MNHKKPLIRGIFRDKIDRTMYQYEKKWFNPVDRKVIKGCVKWRFLSDDSMADDESDNDEGYDLMDKYAAHHNVND